MGVKKENILGAEAQEEKCTEMEMSGELIHLSLHIFNYSIDIIKVKLRHFRRLDRIFSDLWR